jgi:hypothetical protein
VLCTITQHLGAGLSYVAPPALLFFSILLLAASAAAQTVVPITSEPNHHLVISNDYVRVFKVEVPPKTETLYHQHDYDYLYVAIGDADVTSTRLHEKPVSVKLKDGEVEFSKAPFAHKATNNSNQPFRNVTIEILGGIGTPICGIAGREKCCGGIGAGEGGGVGVGDGVASVGKGEKSEVPPVPADMGADFVLKSSRLTAADVTVHGKMQIDLAQIANGPYLLIPVSEVKMTGTSRNSTQNVSAAAGEPVWISDPHATLTNIGDSAKFLLIGFSSTEKQ